MSQRNRTLIYLAIIPIGVVALLSELHPERFYQQVSLMLLTTSSMEAATNGGAIGEPLLAP